MDKAYFVTVVTKGILLQISNVEGEEEDKDDDNDDDDNDDENDNDNDNDDDDDDDDDNDDNDEEDAAGYTNSERASLQLIDEGNV